MTPKSDPPAKTDETPEEGEGGPGTALAGSVADFETSQKSGLEEILRHAEAVTVQVRELAQRPTRAELDEAQDAVKSLTKELSAASTAAKTQVKELETAQGRIGALERELEETQAENASQGRELEKLRVARAADAAALSAMRERVSRFEAAAQSILAGISGELPEPEAAAEHHAPAAPAPEQAPAPVDLGLDDIPAAPAPVVLPDLDEADPFDSQESRERAALVATASGIDDPFDVPEQSVDDGAPAFRFNPAPIPDAEEAPAEAAAEKAAAAAPVVIPDLDDEDPAAAPEAEAADPAGPGGEVSDPFGFMDLPADAPAVQEAPKAVPVYI